MAEKGVPSVSTPEVMSAILQMIRDGSSLRTACKTLDVSCVTIAKALGSEQYTRVYYEAMIERAASIVEDACDIADDGRNDWMQSNDPENLGYKFNGEHATRSRLRVETRKWFASKLDPRRFGDKLDLNHAGAMTVNIAGDFGTPKSKI